MPKKKQSKNYIERNSIDSIEIIKQKSKTAQTNLSDNSSLKIEETVWLTSKEASDYLRISEATLRNMSSNGKIPYSKLGRSNRYSRNDLERLLLSNRRGALYEY